MPKRIDLTGQTFGDLVVVRLSDKRSEKHSNTLMWECLCSCGNTTFVLGFSLLHNHYRSCGCKRVANRDKGVKKHINQDSVDGTRKSALNAKLHKNNKSGHKGVRWIEARKKWTAYIGIQGKVKNLGYFDEKEDAILARKKAEEIYHQPFLE